MPMEAFPVSCPYSSPSLIGCPLPAQGLQLWRGSYTGYQALKGTAAGMGRVPFPVFTPCSDFHETCQWVVGSRKREPPNIPSWIYLPVQLFSISHSWSRPGAAMGLFQTPRSGQIGITSRVCILGKPGVGSGRSLSPRKEGPYLLWGLKKREQLLLLSWLSLHAPIVLWQKQYSRHAPGWCCRSSTIGLPLLRESGLSRLNEPLWHP